MLRNAQLSPNTRSKEILPKLKILLPPQQNKQNYRTVSQYPVLSVSRYPVPGTRYPVPGNRYPVPGNRYPVPGTRYPVPGTWGPSFY